MSVDGLSAPNRTHYLWLALALLLLTGYGSLIPLNYHPIPLAEAVERFRQLPLEDLTQAEPRADWIVNALQYATLSFCWLAALSADRRRYFQILAAALVIPAGWTVAAALEFLQISFPPRTVNANDILIEGLGTILGAVGWLLLGQPITNAVRRFWGGKGLAELAAQALPPYLIGLLIVHLMPFDVVISAAELGEKLHSERVRLLPLIQAESVWHALTNVAAFLPLGALLALVPGGARRGWRWFLGIGLAATLAIESLQFVIWSRFCELLDVATGTAAVLLGRQLVRKMQEVGSIAVPFRVAGARPRLWLSLAAIWAVVLIGLNWQPYHFSRNPEDFLQSDPGLSDENTAIYGLRRMSWAPFVDYYWGSRYQALDQFVRRSLATAPLGICFALAFGRRENRAVWASVLTAAVVGLAIETGQYFIPERHPGITDILIGVAGAWLACRLTRHVVNALDPGPVSLGDGRYYYGPKFSQPSRTSPQPAMNKTAFPHFAKLPEKPLEALYGWLDKRPFWVAIAIICGAPMLLTLGLAMLLIWLMGW